MYISASVLLLFYSVLVCQVHLMCNINLSEFSAAQVIFILIFHLACAPIGNTNMGLDLYCL